MPFGGRALAVVFLTAGCLVAVVRGSALLSSSAIPPIIEEKRWIWVNYLPTSDFHPLWITCLPTIGKTFFVDKLRLLTSEVVHKNGKKNVLRPQPLKKGHVAIASMQAC